MFEVAVEVSVGFRKSAVYWADSFFQLGSGMLAGLIFLFQLAMQFVVSLLFCWRIVG